MKKHVPLENSLKKITSGTTRWLKPRLNSYILEIDMISSLPIFVLCSVKSLIFLIFWFFIRVYPRSSVCQLKPWNVRS